MNAEDIKKTINKIIFTQAITKQRRQLFSRQVLILKGELKHDYTIDIIDQWLWTNTHTPAEGKCVCLNVFKCVCVWELLAVIQHDCQPRQSVSSHSGTFSWSRSVSACVQTCVTVPLRSSEHRAKGQTDRRRRHLLCEGRWDAFFFFWFGAIKAARLVWNHSGTESLSPASRVTNGSSSIYTFSTLFLCFFPFVSIVFESYYGQFTLFSRAQTTDYRLFSAFS